MSSELLVNQAGTIQNLQFLGFTNTSAWGELIDNSNDAGAKEVRIGVFKWRDEDGNTHYGYYIADDASGMTRQKLRDSCRVNNPQSINGESSFGDKSGRFGVGGSAALNVISKTSGSIQKITRSRESRDLFAVEVNYNTDESLPTAHEASRRQEEFWSHLAVRPAGTGTLIIGEVDEENYLEIQQLMMDKTMAGLPWYIATTFHHKIEAGLTIGISIESTAAAPTVVVVPSFNSSGSLSDPRVIRESHDILILKDKTSREIRFAVAVRGGGGDDNECVLSLPLNTKAKINTKWNSLSVESYNVVGIIQCHLAFSQEWDKVHDEQICGQFETGKLVDFREKTIVRQYTRSDRCVISVPTPKKKDGDKSAYPFYENVNQEIVMPATEVSDNLFGTQVNKSQLDEKKIDPELKKLINHLSKVFSDTLWKKYIPEEQRKKKSRSSDDATSVASDDTECLLDDDAVSLSSSTSTTSRAARARRAPSPPAVAGGGGGSTTAKQQPKKSALTVQRQQEDAAAAVPVPVPEPEPVPVPEPIQPPVISTVTTHTKLQIKRSTGLRYLERLYEEQDIAEIVTLLDELIREQQDRMSRTQVDVFLMFMQPTDKYRMLTHLLEPGSSDEFMKDGRTLYDVYHRYYSE